MFEGVGLNSHELPDFRIISHLHYKDGIFEANEVLKSSDPNRWKKEPFIPRQLALPKCKTMA